MPTPHATLGPRTPLYATAHRRTPLRTPPSSPLLPRRCLLHVAFNVVRCTLPPPSFAARCRTQPHTPPHAAVISAAAPALFAGVVSAVVCCIETRGGEQPAAIVLL